MMVKLREGLIHNGQCELPMRATVTSHSSQPLEERERASNFTEHLSIQLLLLPKELYHVLRLLQQFHELFFTKHTDGLLEGPSNYVPLPAYDVIVPNP